MTLHYLGASLYVPAMHPRLASVIGGGITGLRSLIVCLEDSVRVQDVAESARRLTAALEERPQGAGPEIFVRPRDPALLRVLLRDPALRAVVGFVLPKCDGSNLDAWLDSASAHPNARLMPTLETRDVFDPGAMNALRHRLMSPEVHERILALRIGGNDLFGLLGIRRPARRTVYQTTLGSAIDSLVTTFRPWGFGLTGPVFERLDDRATFEAEIAEDVLRGLVGKTAIHPDQVGLIERQFAVQPEDVNEARRILSEDAPAVFRSREAMCEPATHRPWALGVLQRLERFGPAEKTLERP